MSPTNLRQIQLGIAAPLMVIFGVGGAWGLFSGFRQNADAAAAVGWSATEAEILSFSVDTSGEYEVPAVSYRYSAAGRTWTGNAIYPGIPDPEIGASTSSQFKNLFRPGSRVPVHFDPANPGRSALLVLPPTWVRREFLMGAFGLIGACAIGWQVLRMRRSTRSAGVA
jgi:hypothetical protein